MINLISFKDFPGPPSNTGEVLLRDDRIPAGVWFYLNGSAPSKGGLAVIEDSHREGWTGPTGFELFRCGAGRGIRRSGHQTQQRYSRFDVPGCVPLVTAPGDLIVFAARTYRLRFSILRRDSAAGLPFTIRLASFVGPDRDVSLNGAGTTQLSPHRQATISLGSRRASYAGPTLR